MPVEPYADQTPICHVINYLVIKCRDAGLQHDHEKTKAYADMSACVEAALKEYHCARPQRSQILSPYELADALPWGTVTGDGKYGYFRHDFDEDEDSDAEKYDAMDMLAEYGYEVEEWTVEHDCISGYLKPITYPHPNQEPNDA